MSLRRKARPSFNEHKIPTIGKVLVSLFSRSANINRGHGTAEPDFKFPFSVHDGEMALFAYNDVRIGGWGVLFGGITLCAALLYSLSGAWKNAEVTLGLAFILASVLINPGSWWARYAPQVALAPVLMVIPAAASSLSWQRIPARFVCVLLLLNSALIFIPNTKYAIETNDVLQSSIDEALRACGPGIYEISPTDGTHFEQILGKNGIQITYPKRKY